MADGRLRELERCWREQGATEAANAYDVAHGRRGQGISEPRRAVYEDLLSLLRIQARTIFVAVQGTPYPGAVETPLIRLNGVYLRTDAFDEDYAFRWERGGRSLRIVLDPLRSPFNRNDHISVELVGGNGILSADFYVI